MISLDEVVRSFLPAIVSQESSKLIRSSGRMGSLSINIPATTRIRLGEATTWYHVNLSTVSWTHASLVRKWLCLLSCSSAYLASVDEERNLPLHYAVMQSVGPTVSLLIECCGHACNCPCQCVHAAIAPPVAVFPIFRIPQLTYSVNSSIPYKNHELTSNTSHETAQKNCGSTSSRNLLLRVCCSSNLSPQCTVWSLSSQYNSM